MEWPCRNLTPPLNRTILSAKELFSDADKPNAGQRKRNELEPKDGLDPGFALRHHTNIPSERHPDQRCSKTSSRITTPSSIEEGCQILLGLVLGSSLVTDRDGSGSRWQF